MGDWSSGMILVSGARGPGFNSRIAPYFSIMNSQRSEEAMDAEEIVELRLQLFRAKQRVESYNQLVQRNEIYEQIVGRVVDVMQERYGVVHQIAASLGIKSQSKGRDLSELRNVKGVKEGDKGVLARYEKLGLELDLQEDLLGKIGEEVAKVVKHNRETSTQLEEISKLHSRCGAIDAIPSETEEKLRRMEKEIAEKDIQIQQLKKNNASLKQEIDNFRQRQREHLNKINELQTYLKQQATEGAIHRQAFEQSKQSQRERERVLGNCEKLLDLISIPNEDYLKYYFRSSGLALQPPRPQKNKYSIVFDH